MRKLVITLGVLVVLGAGSYAALSVFLNPERIKTTVLPTVSDVLGREVRVDGDISIRLFPTFGFKLEKLVVTNPKNHASGNLLEVEEATLAVAVMPLLKKEIEVREFTLERPKLSLVKMADGTANWEFAGLQANTAAPQEGTSTTAPTATTATSLPVADIRIGTIAVKNGTIEYHDRAGGSKTSLNDTNFELKMPTLNATADVQGSALFNGQKIKGHIKLKTPYGLMHGEPANLKLDATSPMADIITEANITYTTTTPRPVAEVELTQLSLARPDFSTAGAGSLKVILGSTKPEITANLNLSFMELVAAEGTVAAANKPAAAPTKVEPLSWPEEALAFDGLDAADVEAKLKIEQIKAPGYTFGPLFANMSLVNKRLEFNISRFGMFGGTFKTKTVLNARSATPSAAFSATLTGAELSNAMPERASIYGASANMASTIELTTQGRSIKNFMQNLNGTVDLSVTQLGAKNLDIAAVASENLGGLGPIVSNNISDEAIQAIKDKVTDIGISTLFKQGQGQTVLRFGGPVLGQGGEGVINMADARLNLRMNPLLKASKSKDIVLPFFVKGPLNAPTFSPDQEGIAHEVARQVARAGANKLLDKALKKGDGKLGIIGGILDAATNRQNTEQTTEGTEEPNKLNNQAPAAIQDLQKAFGGLFGK